jgi:hypothetical protein
VCVCDDDECESGKIFLSLSLSLSLSHSLSLSEMVDAHSLSDFIALSRSLSLKGVCVCDEKGENGDESFPLLHSPREENLPLPSS